MKKEANQIDIVELRKQLNTHDSHEVNTWSDNKPSWLQVLGAVVVSTGLTLCLYYTTVILFLL